MDCNDDRASTKNSEGDRMGTVFMTEVDYLTNFVSTVDSPKLKSKEISSHGLRYVSRSRRAAT